MKGKTGPSPRYSVKQFLAWPGPECTDHPVQELADHVIEDKSQSDAGNFTYGIGKDRHRFCFDIKTPMVSHLVLRSLKLALLGLLLLQGCASSTGTYQERHNIKNLTVVFLDEESLRHEWQVLSGRQPVVFASQASTGVPMLKTLRGFYDWPSNTLYCPKWNFEVCGHELHHAVLGQFHSD